MPLTVPTTVATGFSDGVGSAYRQATDQLLIADAGAGNIRAVNTHTHASTVVGTGYNAPSDIALSANGLHAYVTENPGTLLRLNLGNLNRAAATVVTSGLNGVDQVSVDDAHGVAYVTEFTGGRVHRVNLATGTRSPVATVFAPRGVLHTSDGRFIYVSSDAGTITRFDFTTNTSAVVATGLNGPRHLTWADAGESVILFPRPNPTGTVLKLDLTTSPPAVAPIAGPTPPAPYSVAVLTPSRLLVTCATAVAEVDLTSGVYSAGGPILLGIGFVPADATHLPSGYADTSVDPTYFFQVKDCPFGGTLPLMVNWEQAHNSLGANFYQVFIARPPDPPVQVTTPFSDYRWSASLNRFELVPVGPAPGGFYPLHAAGQIWLNHWLGLLLDTTGRPNGLNRISVKLFGAQSAASEIGTDTSPGRFANVMIDNTVPTAILEQIFQQPGNSPVGVCSIVSTGLPQFTFRVTASAPQHLRGWSLTAYWGDNKSKPVSSDDYSNHVTPSRLWTGLAGVAVPPPGPTPWDAKVAGDPTSVHCAHSFFLHAWDRVINGWGYIHGSASYQQSLTLFL